MLKRQEFINAFARLGTNVNSNADDIELLEKSAFFLYAFHLLPRSTTPTQSVFRKYLEEEEEWLT